MPPRKPSSPTLRRGSGTTPITAHSHADSRPNIPTEELRDFIAEDERSPKTILYPRDPSLDPQLVWKGKDEQDQHDLAVPAVPIYIQEHIQPQAIVELVKAEAKKEQPQQMGLFADFNGLDFAERVDFYRHEQRWTNRLILGDSLLVMTSLAEKEALKGKVQMIYLDPPYGIKFGSNWQVSTRKRDVKDGKAEDATRQPEQVKAFRDTWQLGIHSYLSYLRDRLTVARELLTESGSIFVQIGDENVHLVRCLLDEVFGSENFCGLISYQKTGGLLTKLLPSRADFIIWFAKSIDNIKYRQLYLEKSYEEGTADTYSWGKFADGSYRGLKLEEKANPALLGDGQVYKPDNLTSQGNPILNFNYREKAYQGGWKTTLIGMERLAKAERIHLAKNSIMYVRYLSDFSVVPLTQTWTDTSTGSFTDEKIYVVQSASKAIERCLLMTTDPGDLVLDPTCGSGTTAYVAEQWGRRWITIDTSRVALALARTRLMAARFPYYLLLDSPEGQKKEREISGPLSPFGDFAVSSEQSSAETDNRLRTTDLRKGFVYKRVPHITLKSIANNEEIDVIHEKYQPRLEALRAQINAAAGKNWQEWEIPRHAPAEAPYAELLQTYWQARRERQREIDASIARRAEVEMLYDQPYEDPKRVRVSGPFTVESLSPHRVLSTEDANYAAGKPESEKFAPSAQSAENFVSMILENLKAAGVQNTIKNERLKFTRLDPYPGTWIHAVGEYAEKDGAVRRAAISIGPELGTVSADQVKEAAKEAVQGVGFDLLIVCGFAFDPHVSEEARRYGRLTVLPARMNPDLAMGGDLLKRTGAGNLFMVFGEPDVEIRPYHPQSSQITQIGKTEKEKSATSAQSADESEKIVVEIKGVDVYDPTTGEIRSNSTDDIACWFIDTDYNGESFIVRHAYFTGADQPYEKLKRALRAEIDESAWSALYSTTSYPFEKPQSGKIAVKVINHYGDEVLKVFEV